MLLVNKAFLIVFVFWMCRHNVLAHSLPLLHFVVSIRSLKCDVINERHLTTILPTVILRQSV